MPTPRRIPVRAARLLPPLRPIAFAVVVLLAGCQGRGADDGADSLDVSVTPPPPASVTRYSEAEQGQEVVVAPGAEFEIALATDPAGGMTWTWADSANSSIVLVDRSSGEDTFVGTAGDTAATGLAGTGTVTVWRFRAPTTGSAPIRLELRRPGEATAAQTYTLTVRPE